MIDHSADFLFPMLYNREKEREELYRLRQQELAKALEPTGFPSEIPERLEAVLGCASKKTQTHRDLNGSVMLATMSACVQDLAIIKVRSMTVPLTLNTVIVAGSGEGKTSAGNMFASRLREHDRAQEAAYHVKKERLKVERFPWKSKLTVFQKEYQQSIGQGERETACLQRLEKHLANEPKDPVQERLLVSDISLAGLHKLIGTGRISLVLWNDEGGGNLRSSLFKDKYTLNSLSGEQNNKIDRGGSHSGYSLANARLGSLLMTQPASFESFIEEKEGLAVSSGLCARWFMCAPPSIISERQIGNEQQQLDEREIAAWQWFEQRQDELLPRSVERREQQKERICLELSPEAEALLIDECNLLIPRLGQDGDLHQHKEFGAKYMEHAVRIAGVVTVFCSDCTVVSAESMRAAIAIANYYFKQYINLVGDTVMLTKISNEARLELWLQHKAMGFFPFSIEKNKVLQGAPKQLRSVETLDRAIEKLVASGKLFLRKEMRNSSGKQVTILDYYQQF